MHVFAGLLIFFFLSTLNAQVSPNHNAIERGMIKGNVAVSNWFDGLAERLDLFLAGERLTTKHNETSIVIENYTHSREGEGVGNSTSLHVNLRLPNVEEYWKLKFTSYDEREEDRDVRNIPYRQRQRSQNYSATVGFFQKLGNVQTAFQPRIELRDPLKVAHSLSFQTRADSKYFRFQPRVEFFAEPDRGTGIHHELNFGFTLSPEYSLALINQATYEDRIYKYSVANGISLSRPVMRSAGISYSVFFNSDNIHEYHLNGYSLAVAWTHFLYRNILDYNLTPFLGFSERDQFRGKAGVNLSVNLKF